MILSFELPCSGRTLSHDSCGPRFGGILQQSCQRGWNVGYNLLTAFTNANLKTYGSLAFVCPYQPGQTDETPLFDAVETLIGRRVNPAEKIPIRRLFFEAHTLALADLKTRFEKDDTSEPSQIPLPERIARLEQQRTRLQGVHFSSETEPAHKLVDLVFQMCQDQQVTCVGTMGKTHQ